MSPEPEELLEEALSLHQSSKFDKCIKAAEKARKKFQKHGQIDRATEALRVMADCTLNARDMKKAEKIYDELYREGIKIDNYWYQSAAKWGLGQVALRRLDYKTAIILLEEGLHFARRIADAWYTAWNAMGLASAYRGTGRLDEAKAILEEAIVGFKQIEQAKYVEWAERALAEIGGELTTKTPEELQPYLCPMCGSRFKESQATSLQQGKLTTCEYCGTAVG
ncbi:MAG: tetratricopeptide repeat protein [Promethearchaeota archaeon]